MSIPSIDSAPMRIPTTSRNVLLSSLFIANSRTDGSTSHWSLAALHLTSSRASDVLAVLKAEGKPLNEKFRINITILASPKVISGTAQLEVLDIHVEFESGIKPSFIKVTSE